MIKKKIKELKERNERRKNERKKKQGWVSEIESVWDWRGKFIKKEWILPVSNCVTISSAELPLNKIKSPDLNLAL